MHHACLCSTRTADFTQGGSQGPVSHGTCLRRAAAPRSVPGNGKAQPCMWLRHTHAAGFRGLGPSMLAGGLMPLAAAALRTCRSAEMLWKPYTADSLHTLGRQ